MLDYISYGLALLTIGLGAFGFLAPRYTASVLDLQTTNTTMGLSEMRASVGALFVALGFACLFTGSSSAYFMLGVVYTGTATGRAASLILDAPPFRKALTFFTFEAVPAAFLLWAHTLT
jgi:hypothetical protein